MVLPISDPGLNSVKSSYFLHLLHPLRRQTNRKSILKKTSFPLMCKRWVAWLTGDSKKDLIYELLYHRNYHWTPTITGFDPLKENVEGRGLDDTWSPVWTLLPYQSRYRPLILHLMVTPTPSASCALWDPPYQPLGPRVGRVWSRLDDYWPSWGRLNALSANWTTRCFERSKQS